MKLKNRYFILRHGQTIYQTRKKKFVYPWPDNPPVKLTKIGKEQIKIVAKKLKSKKIDFIYSSDIFRTQQTSKIVARELKVPIYLDKGLRDVNLGVYHGKLREVLYKDFSDITKRFSKKPKGGEALLDCQKRVVNFLKEIEKKFEGKSILIISHGDPLWLLEGWLLGKTQEELLKQKMEHSTINAGELRKF